MSRNLAVDSLKIVLALMVVGLHAAFLKESSPLASHLLVNGVFRIAVPVFFVINGYYLVGAIDDWRRLRPWLVRMALLYSFWMAVYLPFYVPLDEGTVFLVVKRLVRVFLVGYHHLWYVSAMCYAAIALHLLRNRKPGELMILSVVLFLSGACLQYYNYLAQAGIPIWYYRNAIFLAFPMMTAGYLVKKQAALLPGPDLMRVLTLLGCALLLLESYLSFDPRIEGRGIDIYFSLLLLSPSLFIMCTRSLRKTDSEHLSSLSSGIYFVHPLLMMLLVGGLHVPEGSGLFVGAVFLCLLAYFPLLFLAKRVKFVL